MKKTYGIYLAYPPGLDLRAEGLGRHLIAFLSHARSSSNARFAIACPSWMRDPLRQILEEGGIPADAFEIIGPRNKPILLDLYDRFQARKRRTRRTSNFRRLVGYIKAWRLQVLTRIAKIAVATRSPATLLALVSFGLPAWFIGAGLRLIRTSLIALERVTRNWASQIARPFSALASSPRDNPVIVRLYRLMEDAEFALLRKDINARKDISAWYCPTAFWPHFNKVEAPRLICVPDVVLSDFPVAFSAINGDRFLEVFKLVEATIEGGHHFVTYSQDSKYRTLVERYHKNAEAVTVIPHGNNRLDQLIAISGSPDNAAATRVFCRELIRRALAKAIGSSRFSTVDFKFIFYASKFRPNKNIISLLRAYEYLLRRKYIGHKLVLTGQPHVLPEIAHFISQHDLQEDVLCLHGLSEQELAACYHNAELAVNPSLSEGGCPFTLTEALSVGTPVVMARIAVTMEVVAESKLQRLMLFDPYDWRDIAARIEWALQNSDALLEDQLRLYERLAERSWRTVVDEHIAVLDRISSPAIKPESVT